MYETVPNAPTASAPAATTINASRAEEALKKHQNMSQVLRRASKLGGRRTKKRSRKSKASKKIEATRSATSKTSLTNHEHPPVQLPPLQ
jgi:hypothetical protein